MTTTIINIRNAPKNWKSDSKYVYIGRRFNRGNYELSASKFGNRFIVGKDGIRGECVKKFENDILYDNLRLFNQVIQELQDKILICWCKPASCHGDILAAIANGQLKFKGNNQKVLK